MWDVYASKLGRELVGLVNGREFDQYAIDPAFIGQAGQCAEEARKLIQGAVLLNMVGAADQTGLMPFMKALDGMIASSSALVGLVDGKWMARVAATKEDAQLWSDSLASCITQISDQAYADIAGAAPGGSLGSRPN